MTDFKRWGEVILAIYGAGMIFIFLLLCCGEKAMTLFNSIDKDVVTAVSGILAVAGIGIIFIILLIVT